jgi:YidC/Oxa1 family membrane protein insertase
MDKRSLLAVTLITVIVMGWLFYTSTYQQKSEPKKFEKSQTDSLAEQPSELKTIEKESLTESSASISNKDSIANYENYGIYFAPFTNGYQEIITIETELYTAKLSRRGALLYEFTLKKYKQWNNFPSQMIWASENKPQGQLYLTFITKDAKKIDTRNLYFNFDNKGKKTYEVSGDNFLVFTAKLEIEKGKYIEKTFKFYGNQYIFDTEITLNNLDDIIPTRGYNYVWSDGLKYQEKNSVDESSDAQAMVSLNGEILDVDATDEPIEETGTGLIDFAGIKTKYFGAAIVPNNEKPFDGSVDVYGFKQHARKDGIVERYDISYRVPYDGGKSTNKFKVYIGPLDYDIVSEYGLSKMVYFGWGFIRYIGEYLILPLFMFIHGFIPNYGITIIVFSIIMKFLLYPLSIQQMRSAQKMKLLGPEMEKIRTKYADDNTTQQKEMMKLYQDYGINPAGGCLPLLLQMPILFALWSVLRTQIDLRQADFIWWITDLSLPDVLVSLPFSFLGIQFISGLALLMGITMFIQQKITITDPRQKAMIYMMPIMFTLIFSNLPSGLNLYYFMFNLFGILQQIYINNFSKNQPTLADMKKAPKKEGWLQKKMREAQEMAEHRGGKLPGNIPQKNQNQGKPRLQPKKKK